MLVIFALIAAISLPPKPDHYVTDRAGVLTNAKALDDRLAQFERDSSDQILVYVDQHLPPDTTIEEMGSEAMRKWGVGQKGKDNGAILFVFIADRKMRIEVGYGLEGALTDAKSKRIIETVIKPQFQRGDYSAGINDGASAIIATVRGEPYKGTGRTAAQIAGNLFLQLVSYFFLLVMCWIAIKVSIGQATMVLSHLRARTSFLSGSSSSSKTFSGGNKDGGGGASGSW